MRRKKRRETCRIRRTRRERKKEKIKNRRGEVGRGRMGREGEEHDGEEKKKTTKKNREGRGEEKKKRKRRINPFLNRISTPSPPLHSPPSICTPLPWPLHPLISSLPPCTPTTVRSDLAEPLPRSHSAFLIYLRAIAAIFYSSYLYGHLF